MSNYEAIVNGHYVKEMRKLLKISQSELGDALDVTQVRIAQIEKDMIKYSTYKKLEFYMDNHYKKDITLDKDVDSYLRYEDIKKKVNDFVLEQIAIYNKIREV